MRRVALDIETMADPERVANMPEPEVALGNLKDPVKIKEKMDAAREKQKENAALSPYFGRVLAVGLAMETEEDAAISEVSVTNGNNDAAERSLLEWAWKKLSQYDQLVTFNGANFDFPFLYRRSLILNVVPVPFSCDRYKVLDIFGEHVDVGALLWNTEVGGGFGAMSGHGLQFYAKQLLGLEPDYDPDLPKGQLGQLLADGHAEVIIKLCRWDVETTLKLAQKVLRFFA